MRIYENPLKTSENRLPNRSYYVPQGVSKYLSLNGEWKFKYFNKDIDYSYNICDWDTIPVPSCWQLYGYDNPNYSNSNYPFPCDEPYVPDDNPCGIYEREFIIEEKLGKTYFIFEGVSSCAFLYINGRYVGFTQGSHLQAEFDITDFVILGVNTVRVKVLKWCCGSYLEDQDYFRFNGIFRDCYILERPAGHITDIFVTASDTNMSIKLSGSANVKIYEDKRLIYDNNIVDEFIFSPEHPILWNAEKPFLYNVVLEREGEIIELNVGLRKVTISDKKELLINDTPVKLFGINHHDNSKTDGWYMTNAQIQKDLELMKELNINCIRTSHYPPTPYLVELCDKLGFYVILETDLECHGFSRRRLGLAKQYDVESGEWVSTLPQWKNEFIQRMERAVECFKNFSSVIMWSTGNESGYGVNHKAMIDWTRERDNSRLIHCADASLAGFYDVPDVFSRMYLSFNDLEEYANNNEIKTPVFLCEYAHAMGNGPGDVWDYREIFDKYPNIIGGCIWEWADHVVVDDNGVQRYGGDFKNELTHDGNFCCDGLVFADRSLKAGSLEAKAAYQPIKTTFDDGVLKIYNCYSFTNLDEFDFEYSIESDGEIVFQRTRKIYCEPFSCAEVEIEKICLNYKYGAYVNCRLIKSGKIVAFTQHKYIESLQRYSMLNKTAKLFDDEKNIYTKGNNFIYTFSKHYGGFSSIKINDEEQLSGLTKLSVFKAPTDNEREIRWRWMQENMWQGDNLNHCFNKVYDCRFSDGVIYITGAISGVARMPVVKYDATYKIFDNGVIDVSVNAQVREDAASLPRFGFDFELDSDIKDFSYYGCGPYESYCDMKHASSIGMYNSNIDNEYVDYVRPQEHGNHCDTKLLNIGRLSFSAERFEFNVSKYSTNSIFNARHTDELVCDNKTHLRIDYKVAGIGSASCGPELDAKYQIDEKQFEFNFKISPTF